MTLIDAQSVARPQLTEIITDELIRQITENGLGPGDRLPSEAELVEQFDVSRTVIRESLRQLSALGIVSLRQGRPTTVSAPRADPLQNYFSFAVSARSAGLWEGFELRRSLETEAAALAAARATDDVLDELGRVVESMRSSVRVQDQWVKDDLRFHVLIAKGSGNDLMGHVIEAISDVIQVGVRTLYERKDLLNVDETYRRHADLYEAIRSRDSGRARRAMVIHFEAIEAKAFPGEQRGIGEHAPSADVVSPDGFSQSTT